MPPGKDGRRRELSQCICQRGKNDYANLVEHRDEISPWCRMSEDIASVRIVEQRLYVTQHLSKLNAPRGSCLNAKGGAEIEISRLRLDIERSGEALTLLRALEQAEQHLASIEADRETRNFEITTTETELTTSKRASANHSQGGVG